MEAILSPTWLSQAQNPFSRTPPFGSPKPPLLPGVKTLFHTSAFKGKLLRSAGGRSCRAVTRAMSFQEYTPDAQFYKVEAILRPWRIAHVSSGLLKMGIRGVTVSDVRGFGAQGGSMERHAGSEFSEDSFVAKVKMEIVVSKDQAPQPLNSQFYWNSVVKQAMGRTVMGWVTSCEVFVVEEVVNKIIEEARTGEIGDGKIFLIPVSDVIRVRTGERGEKAERMAGGRADMTSVVTPT